MKSRIYNMGTILLVCRKDSNTCLDKYQHQLTQFMPLTCFFPNSTPNKFMAQPNNI